MITKNEAGGTVQVGDTVMRKPITIPKSVNSEMGTELMSGKVVYVHPQGRFHVVEFAPPLRNVLAGITAGVAHKERRGLRESFFGVKK